MRLILAASCVVLLPLPCPAHYVIFLPESPSAKKGEAVTFTYRWGHPFEHEMFDAPPPARLSALLPDGKKIELAKALEKIQIPGGAGKPVGAYKYSFTPEQRGDHLFLLQTPPMWMPDAKEFYQDLVQVVLHVQTQKGWSNDPALPFRVVPLTRPYGLLPRMVFQAQALLKEVPKVDVADPTLAPTGLPSMKAAKPASGIVVEIEMFNPAPPKQLPPDELVTFKTRTDPNGVYTFAFPEPGWWCLTAIRDGGKRDYDGTEYPLRQRVTLWVHVAEK